MSKKLINEYEEKMHAIDCKEAEIKNYTQIKNIKRRPHNMGESNLSRAKTA